MMGRRIALSAAYLPRNGYESAASGNRRSCWQMSEVLFTGKYK